MRWQGSPWLASRHCWGVFGSHQVQRARGRGGQGEASQGRQTEGWEKAGIKVGSVECEGRLPAKVGAVQRCVLAEGGEKYAVTVTASSVEGAGVKFNVKVDGVPMAGV